MKIGDQAPELRHHVRTRVLQREYGLSQEVAERVVSTFGGSDLSDADRKKLQQVKGIGPATAEEINPPRTRLFRAYEKTVSDGGLFPCAPPKNGKRRVSLTAETVALGIELAVAESSVLRRALQDAGVTDA